MTPEGKVKQAVKKRLKEVGAYYHFPVQNGMGSPTLDCVGCLCGEFFAVEAKAPGKKLTNRQKLTADSMRAAGALVFVIDSVEAARKLFTNSAIKAALKEQE